LSIAGAALPSAAIGAPEYATPNPNSPAGTEYALPLDQARGGDKSHNHGHDHGSGGSNSSGSGGTGSGGSGGTGSGGSGPGGTGATSSGSPLFGAGIHRAHAAGKSHSSGGAKGHAPAVTAVPTGGQRSAIDTAANSGGSNGPVALLVLFVLLGAAALATVIRFAGRRSPPRGAA